MFRIEFSLQVMQILDEFAVFNVRMLMLQEDQEG